MKDQFVPYDLALKIRELGFNELCFTAFNKKKEIVETYASITNYYVSPDKSLLEFQLSTYPQNVKIINNIPLLIKSVHPTSPLWQQAFDWFSDNEGMPSNFVELGVNKFHWRIVINGDRTGLIKGASGIEKSRLEARRICLTKLIELCTKK